MLDIQDYTTQIDHHQGNGNGNRNGYSHLQDDWALFYKVAKGFVKRVKPEDTEATQPEPEAEAEPVADVDIEAEVTERKPKRSRKREKVAVA